MHLPHSANRAPTAAPKTPVRSRRAAQNAQSAAPTPATPSEVYPHTDITVTRTITKPTKDGPITATVTRSVSKPTIVAGALGVDDADLEAGLEDGLEEGSFNFDEFDDIYESPPSPSPQPQTIRQPAATHAPVPTAAASPRLSSVPGTNAATSAPQHTMLAVAPTTVTIVRPSAPLRVPNLNSRAPAPARRSVHSFMVINGRSVVKEFLPTHPNVVREKLRGIRSRKWFVLSGGQEAGVYPLWSDVLARSTKEFRIAEGRHTLEEAMALYTWAYENRLIFIQPTPGSLFDNDRYVERELPQGLEAIPIIDTFPDPEDLDIPDGAENYYLVKRGEEAGVWATWIEAGARTQRVKGKADWSLCKSKAEAIAQYKKAHDADQIKVIPVPGGIFDKRLILPPFPA